MKGPHIFKVCNVANKSFKLLLPSAFPLFSYTPMLYQLILPKASTKGEVVPNCSNTTKRNMIGPIGKFTNYRASSQIIYFVYIYSTELPTHVMLLNLHEAHQVGKSAFVKTKPYSICESITSCNITPPN